MQQESMSLVEFQRRFVSDEACMEHLLSLRWPDGYTCPRCGHRRCCFHSTRLLFQCSACKYQVSVTAGTIFHKTDSFGEMVLDDFHDGPSEKRCIDAQSSADARDQVLQDRLDYGPQDPQGHEG